MADPHDPGTFERPVSAWLATVLAAAAKGSRSHDPIYVVARYEPNLLNKTRPFDVHQPVATPEEADEVKKKAEEEHPGVAYGIFGPFVNDEDPAPPPEQDTVASIVVTTTKGKTLPIEGNKFDALFFTYQAVEKFVLPLYVQEYGLEYAAKVLEEFNQNGLALMAHLPWSEETLLVDPSRHGIPVLLRPNDSGVVEPEPVTLPSPGQA